jgi:hypothetical protein
MGNVIYPHRFYKLMKLIAEKFLIFVDIFKISRVF